MPGEKPRGISRNAGLLLSLLALVALAIFAWVETDPTASRESLCEQASVLRDAGLLAKARDTYAQAADEGGECGEGGPAAVEAQAAAAGERFESAHLYVAARPAPPSEEEKKATAAAAKGAVATVEAKREALTRIVAGEYIAGLEISPFEELARRALEAELKALKAPAGAGDAYFCRLSGRLVGASLLDNAATTAARAIVEAPDACALPLARLKLRRQLATSSLREGQRLSAAGEAAPAREQFAQALQLNAGLIDARTSLEDALDDESFLDEVGSWLAGVPDTLKNALAWLIPLAIGLMLLALLGWIAVRELAARSPRARSWLEAMARARVLSFLRKAAVPTVSVEDFDGAEVGKDFSTLLGVGLPKESGREPAFPFDRVTKGSASDGTAAGVATVLTEVPQTKLLGTVLQALGRLFRRRAIKLRGHLQPAGDRGAGVTLVLEGAGIAADTSITLWEETFDPLPSTVDKEAGRWLRLVPAATVWVRWQLAAAHWPRGEDPPSPADWEPDAFFLCGVGHQAQGDWVRAEALYVEALEHDPSLLPAAHNLAVIEIRQGRYRQAEERLRALRSTLGGADRERWPILDTASRYSLALALCYPALVNPSPTDVERRKLGEALDETEELVKALARPAAELPDDPAVRKELRSALAPTVVVLASLKLRSQPGLAAEAAGRAISGAKAKRIGRRRLLRSLAQSQPADLIDGFVRQRRNVSRRTHYNLACYYTTLGCHCSGSQREQCFDLALESLRQALVGKDLSKWAGKDPSLEPLIEARPERVARLRSAPPPHPRGQKPEGQTKAQVTSAA